MVNLFIYIALLLVQDLSSNKLRMFNNLFSPRETSEEATTLLLQSQPKPYEIEALYPAPSQNIVNWLISNKQAIQQTIASDIKVFNFQSSTPQCYNLTIRQEAEKFAERARLTKPPIDCTNVDTRARDVSYIRQYLVQTYREIKKRS